VAARLAAADPYNTSRQRDLIIIHVKVCGVFASHGEHVAAVKEVQSARELANHLLTRFPGNADFQLAVHNTNSAYFMIQIRRLSARLALTTTAASLIWAALKLVKVSAWFCFVSLPMLILAFAVVLTILLPVLFAVIRKSRLVRRIQAQVDAAFRAYASNLTSSPNDRKSL